MERAWRWFTVGLICAGGVCAAVGFDIGLVICIALGALWFCGLGALMLLGDRWEIEE